MSSPFRMIIAAILFFTVLILCSQRQESKIFDVHLHADPAPEKQMHNLAVNGVYSIAVSTSWPQQLKYKTNEELEVLRGLFVACPNGLVPHSQQKCFEGNHDWPDTSWVEQQIADSPGHR